MFLSLLALLVGLWGGLARIGRPVPEPHAGLAPAHGPLMVCGFLGTLIGLERAAGLGRVWTYAAPLLSALGVVALLIGLPAPFLFVAASLGLALVFGYLLRLQGAAFMMIMAAGAGAWLVGNVLWLAGSPMFRMVPWLTGFLVLTIVGERLETQPPRAPFAFRSRRVIERGGSLSRRIGGDGGGPLHRRARCGYGHGGDGAVAAAA